VHLYRQLSKPDLGWPAAGSDQRKYQCNSPFHRRGRPYIVATKYLLGFADEVGTVAVRERAASLRRI
jgi:hypothetical protein